MISFFYFYETIREENKGLDAEELRRLERRRLIFKTATGTRKSVHLTMVVAPELKRNAVAFDIQSVVSLDDLFCEGSF